MPGDTPDLPPHPITGRFAPSPTGPLHFGSLTCAVASYLDARAINARWLVRMEDLDPPREIPGSADLILRSLEAHGLEWDAEVVFQSSRHDAYADALNRLSEAGLTYYCTCTRRDMASMDGGYDGRCRGTRHAPESPAAIRFQLPGTRVRIDDATQGVREYETAQIGDCVILRKDRLYAYQLAVVVDDAWQGVTHVVRGSDLLDSTPWQVLLFQALGSVPPDWRHIPVISSGGAKLSKQTAARPLDDRDAGGNLLSALHALGQPVGNFAPGMAVEEILREAVRNWDPRRIPRRLDIPLDELERSTR